MRAPKKTFTNARKLRKDLSLPEVVLWDCLRNTRLEGLRFRRQHPVGPYVLDFYCPSGRLAVEVDGLQHDHPGQIAHDKRRDRWLTDSGIRVMRIAATDVLQDHALEGVLVMIAHAAAGVNDHIGNMPPPPPSAVPLPRERGRIKVPAGRDAGYAPAKLGWNGDAGSSPAKRGRGTTRSVVEGAHAHPEDETP
ncbi:MAG: endonuclease domain-containing protein [Rhizobiaceae bacterium]